MLRCSVLAALLTLSLGPSAVAAPEVVVSIKPLHSLAARIMEGVSEPSLLVGSNASLHSYSLRPSQAEALQEADLVIWGGPVLEAFLHEPLDALAVDAKVIETLALPGLVLLPARVGGAWEGQEHEEAEAHEESEAQEHAIDGHFFLDPANAAVVADAIAVALAELDPVNAARYDTNATALRQELAALDAELAAGLAPIQARPFVVFHDAYQYLERRYSLAAVGSITVSPEQQPGARRLAELRDKLSALHVVCLFVEPGAEPALVEILRADAGIRSAVLDPEGLALTPGPALYGELLRGLAESLRACLAP